MRWKIVRISLFNSSSSLASMPCSFCLKTPNKESLRFPGPANKPDTAPACISNKSFLLAQFWQYGIENCLGVTANFCKQYRPISWNIPGLIWSQYLINEVLCSETIPLWQKIRNSETVRIENNCQH
jgi:hypothetical protein